MAGFLFHSSKVRDIRASATGAFCLGLAGYAKNPVFDYNRAARVGEEGIYREVL